MCRRIIYILFQWKRIIIPILTKASQGIVSPEYVIFFPPSVVIAIPNAFGQCLTKQVFKSDIPFCSKNMVRLINSSGEFSSFS